MIPIARFLAGWMFAFSFAQGVYAERLPLSALIAGRSGHSSNAQLSRLSIRDIATVSQPLSNLPHKSEYGIILTPVVGEEHGRDFTDAALIGSHHKRISSIEFAGCEPGEHLTYIKVTYKSPEGALDSVEHGIKAGNAKPRKMDLPDGHRIVKVQVSTWRKKVGNSRRTRIGWIKVTTAHGTTMTCGSRYENDKVHEWVSMQKNESLLYFLGSQGDEIDALQAAFIPDSNY